MRRAKSISLLNGPNLSLLGLRDPSIYGGISLFTIEERLRKGAAELGYSLVPVQSDSEAGLIHAIHAARWSSAAIIINPGGLTHTSIALRDALELFPGPIAEVHISDIYAREEFRHHSFVKDIASVSIVGKGPDGYLEALRAVHKNLTAQKAEG